MTNLDVSSAKFDELYILMCLVMVQIRYLFLTHWEFFKNQHQLIVGLDHVQRGNFKPNVLLQLTMYIQQNAPESVCFQAALSNRYILPSQKNRHILIGIIFTHVQSTLDIENVGRAIPNTFLQLTFSLQIKSLVSGPQYISLWWYTGIACFFIIDVTSLAVKNKTEAR